MPAHAKTSEEDIVLAARKLVEERGRNDFSMNDVAAAVGVRAPSLYGRFADRNALLDAVEVSLWWELRRKMERAKIARDPIASLTAQSHAYRAWARSNPEAYGLLYRPDAEQSKAGHEARSAAVFQTFDALVALAGEKDALAAARVLTPFLHGFVTMELAGAFRMGGGLDDAFALGIATILKGLCDRKKHPAPRESSRALKRKPTRTRS